MSAVSTWIRRRDNALSNSIYLTAKHLRTFDFPVIPGLHKILYATHKAMSGLTGFVSRTIYYTPMFRSRLLGTSAHLHLAGSGMPLVTGPVRIVMGDRCRLSTALTISGRTAGCSTPKLCIGDNVGIGWQTTIAVGRMVTLEDNVRIAGRAFLAGYPGHPINAEDRAAGKPDTDDQVGDIILRKNVWLGTGCTVSAGVEIGENTIVAAGSVVTKSLPANVVAAGVPVRIVRSIENERQENNRVVSFRK